MATRNPEALPSFHAIGEKIGALLEEDEKFRNLPESQEPPAEEPEQREETQPEGPLEPPPEDLNEQQSEEASESSDESKNKYELPESLDELIEQLGVDTEKFNSLKVRVKVDGVESNVSLKDTIASFQTQKHVTQKSMAVSEKEKKIDEINRSLEADRAKTTNFLSELSALITLNENQLTSEYNTIDWQNLQQEDPARWAALKVEFNERIGSIQNAKHQFTERLNKEQRDWEAQQQRSQQERLNVEREALYEKLPEWKDPVKRDSERVEIARFLQSKMGFTDADVNSLTDHRYIIAARNAWLYDKLQSQKPAVQKKLENLPPVMKGGRPKTTQEVSAAARLERANRLRSGNLTSKQLLDEAANAIGDLYEL